MIACAVSDAPSYPIRADVITVGLGFLPGKKHRELVCGPGGVMITPDDIILTGFMGIEFPAAPSSVPTITTLKANYLKLGMGRACPYLAVDAY